MSENHNADPVAEAEAMADQIIQQPDPEAGFLSSADDFLSLKDEDFRTVFVPHWKKNVMLKRMTAAEHSAYETSMVEMKDGGGAGVRNMDNYKAKLLVRMIVNPQTRQRVFMAKDHEVLGKKHAGAVDYLYEEATDLNGITARNVKKAERALKVQKGSTTDES